MKYFIALFLLVAVGAYAEKPEDSDFHGQAEITKFMNEISQDLPFAERLRQASGKFLGKPYVADALGEGVKGKFDKDPVCRADGFDCVTYVETAVAMAISQDWDHFKTNLLRMRYDHGRVNFLNRNHFAELDWIPNNIHFEKIFTDVTPAIGGNMLMEARTTIKKRPWFKWRAEIALHDPKTPAEDREYWEAIPLLVEGKEFDDKPNVTLNYIPFKAVLPFSKDRLDERTKAEDTIKANYPKPEEMTPEQKKELRGKILAYRRDFLKRYDSEINHELLAKIPSGLVITYVHPDKPTKSGTNMLVTHQALLVRDEKGQLFQRQASQNGVVSDIPFAEYVFQYVPRTDLEPEGFNLLKLLGD